MFFSLGDVIDLYFQLLTSRKAGAVFKRFMMSDKNRTNSWWSSTSSAPRNWWNVPAIRARWNRKISGNEITPYIEHVHKICFADDRPVRLLSPGCGDGAKECAIAKKYPYWHLTGLDASQNRVDAARKNAEEHHISNITFRRIDIDTYRFKKNAFDAVLFDSSLHHFSGFDLLFSRIKQTLAPEGVVIVNEYVGPDRFNWTKQQLALANTCLQHLPERYRVRLGLSSVKRRIYRSGYLRMIMTDPSEAVHASQIRSALHRNFTTVTEVSLGGNLLHLVLKDIAHHFISGEQEAASLLENVCKTEEDFLTNHSSDFIFGIYAPPREGEH